jgi:hypothetical protein
MFLHPKLSPLLLQWGEDQKGKSKQNLKRVLLDVVRFHHVVLFLYIITSFREIIESKWARVTKRKTR